MDCVASLAVFLLITMMALFAGQSEAEHKKGGKVIFSFLYNHKMVISIGKHG